MSTNQDEPTEVGAAEPAEQAVPPTPSVPQAPTPSVPVASDTGGSDAVVLKPSEVDTPTPPATPAPRPMPEVPQAESPTPEPSSKQNGHATPPWQRDATPSERPPRDTPPPPPPPRDVPTVRDIPREPQREPQSNLYRPGQSPVTGRPGAGMDPASPSRSLSDMAAKAARKEAAMVKSVGIDGPTRSIARPELIKDMPDLSELRHPTPLAVDSTGPQPIVAPPPFVKSVHSTGPIPVIADGEQLRATVQLRRIDPWSTLKLSLIVSVVVFFVWMIAIGLLYLVLDGMGVWDRLNSTFADVVSDSGSDGLVSAGQVFGYSGLLGLLGVVLFTALATIGAFIYNQCADIVGGVQVTLADPD